MTRLLQLTENALRSAPPVLEEAQAMRETMEQQQLSQRDLARLLGKNRGYIENRVRLLKMEPALQEMVTQRPTPSSTLNL
jgi:ParB family chromosome partitioning protein